MVPYSFCGEEFRLVPRGAEGRALYWPREQALLVADLHLEKSSFYARSGQMLPPYDSRETLERLALAIRETGARRVFALGDNFHDDGGTNRLEPHAAGMLAALTRAVDWVWITGNHDPQLAGLPGMVADELVFPGDLRLRHEPAADGLAEIVGHLHPAARLPTRAGRQRRRCFVASETRLLLPAFGSLTGALCVSDPAISGLFPTRGRVFLMLGEGLAELPMAALV